MYHGYHVVAATFTLNLIAYGIWSAGAILVVPLNHAFEDMGPAAVDFYPSLMLSVALKSGLTAGWLQTWLSMRGLPIQISFYIGSLCLGVGLVMSSLATNLGIVLIGAIVTGVGMGWTGYMAAGVCVLWFQSSRRGTMLMLAMAGTGFGSMGYALGMHNLLEILDENDGWRPAMRIMGLVSMVVAMIASTAMRLPEPNEVEKYEQQALENADEDDSEAAALVEKMYGSTDTNHSPFSLDSANEKVKLPTEKGTRSAMRSSHMDVAFPRQSVVAWAPDRLDSTRRATVFPGRRSSVTALGNTLHERYVRTHPSMKVVLQGNGRDDERRAKWGARASKRASNIAELQAVARLQTHWIEAYNERNAEIQEEESTTLESPTLSFFEVTYTRTTLALLVWCVVSSFGYTNFMVHISSYCDSVPTLTQSDGAHALSVIGIGILLGNLTLGYVTDVLGPLRTLQLTMTVLMALFFVWPYCHSSTSLIIVALLYGYNATTQTSVPLIIIADAFGETSPDSILTLLGFLNIAKFPGFLFGPTVCGYLYEEYQNYHMASIFTGVVMLVGNLCLFIIPSTEEQARIVMERHTKKKAAVLLTC